MFDPGAVQSWAALFFQVGGLAFGFLVPVLAGFIAYAIADRPALVPGFVGGMIAVQTHAGFLGGLVAGLLAGAIVYGLKPWQPPRALAGIMPVLVLPLIGTAVVGAIMFLVVGTPLAGRHDRPDQLAQRPVGHQRDPARRPARPDDGLRHGWSGQQGRLRLRRRRAVHRVGDRADDHGCGDGGRHDPPLALALATTVRKNLFTKVEQENGRAAWLLGASFITEGAIPFAAGDPLRVIPSLMAGSAVAGSLSMAFGATLRARTAASSWSR